jgi:hypothetical protein
MYGWISPTTNHSPARFATISTIYVVGAALKIMNKAIDGKARIIYSGILYWLIYISRTPNKQCA